MSLYESPQLKAWESVPQRAEQLCLRREIKTDCHSCISGIFHHKIIFMFYLSIRKKEKKKKRVKKGRKREREEGKDFLILTLFLLF